MDGDFTWTALRSFITVGLLWIASGFDWGTDILPARQTVSEKVSLAAGDLPPESGRPVLAPISSIMGEILFLSLTSDRHAPIDLRTTADTVIRRRLLAVPGVAQVTPIGGEEKQYQVHLSPERLRAHGISLEEVTDALSDSNRNVSAGFLVERGSEYLVTGVGRVVSTADIASTMITAVGGVPVRVGDLGEVKLGGAPKRGEASAMGTAAVILGIQKQPGANTLSLTRELDGVLDTLERELPDGMKIDRHIFRQSDFIEVAVRNVELALRDGAVLVIAIVFLFLANVRAAAITLTAIPLSLLASVLVLRGLGATVNTMTLGGMTIAIGALVDDAIIDVENVFRRLRENARLPEDHRRPAIQVVLDATIEIRTSIVFATLIILLVFLPLFFLPGVEGRLLKPLGIAYVVALAASLVVAVTVTPALSSILLPRTRAVREAHEPKVTGALKALYGRILGPTLRHPWLVAAPCILMLAGALASSSLLGRSFLPEFNEGALAISAVTLPGTSLPESDELGRIVETINQAGAFDVRATAIGRGTAFGKIIEAVERAERSRAPIQKTADRLSGYLVSFALAGASLTFLLTRDVRSTIAVVIVAGACGVAAGTPLAILGAIGRAARAGAIVKGGRHLEALATVDTVVLDKTGTLTLGNPEVTAVLAAPGVKAESVVEAAAIAERASEHPLARAILEKALALGLVTQTPDRFDYAPGQGISCWIGGERILVGRRSFLVSHGIVVSPVAAGGPTSEVFVARGDRLHGWLHISDTLRSEAGSAVGALRAMDLGIVLLTGDASAVARDVGAQLGILDVHSELLPDEKVSRIRSLLARGRKVAMIGDGFNDAPALAEATVGVAMGSGTDVTRECAGIVLLGNDLTKFVETLRLARRCRRTIHQNFLGTVLVDAVGVGLAAFGLLSPLFAALVHVSSEMLFILNSARLLPVAARRGRARPPSSRDRMSVAATESLL